MNIVTEYWAKPVPSKAFDWSAIDRDTYDGVPDAGACRVIGFGPTEQAAIDDLLDQMDFGEDWQREDARTYRADNGAFGVGA